MALAALEAVQALADAPPTIDAVAVAACAAGAACASAEWCTVLLLDASRQALLLAATTAPHPLAERLAIDAAGPAGQAVRSRTEASWQAPPPPSAAEAATAQARPPHPHRGANAVRSLIAAPLFAAAASGASVLVGVLEARDHRCRPLTGEAEQRDGLLQAL
ncbi:hypothetical protein FNF27_05750 [Cafeteria roenbergensis]|uniref:GAF domain-containing protein n=1 Tax=Cafeteria roenbergensis TaxID=33653 RepID=A0A5A8CTZ3_CAFRO|nr:hypothetical protein FNF31_05896 [Cafeteria roenbergensis]KAA0172770.1 hypothetical protein FNF27_05750 [Cafeteria roenbergensis]